MVLQPSHRHYALTDRALSLLRKGKLYTLAIIGGSGEPAFSDADIGDLLGQEEEDVILTVVKLKVDKQRPGGAFFSLLDSMVHDLSNYGVFEIG